MKRLLLPVLMLLLISGFTLGQTVLDNFDNAENDTTYKTLVEGSSTVSYTNDNSDFKEGTGSLKIKAAVAPDIHTWGSYVTLQKKLPEGTYFDLSSRDTLSIWIKVSEAPVTPANVVFRFHLMDQPTTSDNIEEYIYQNDVILDATTDWVELKAPLFEREIDTGDPNDTGFILFPSSWSRSASGENNKVFDLDKIIGYNITFVTTTAAADSVVYNIDKFVATGNVAIPYTFFNGVDWVSNITMGLWGNTTLDIVAADEIVSGKKAVAWTQGDGWTGFYGNLDEPGYNMSSGWLSDSLKIKMKAPEGTGAIRLQLMDLTDSGNKIGSTFTPTGDNQWHEYFFPLRDMIYQDGSTSFDSTHAAKLEIMAENSGVSGRVVYFTDIWTGTPEFDVIPPVAVTGVSGIADDYQNLITWTDVPGEASEKYDVYFSTSPITDISASGVEVVETGINGDVGLTTHLLRAPKTDQSVTYYYAIVCRDADGNAGPVSESSASVTNTAKGVPVIETTTVNFVADGDLSEWSSITPIEMSVSKGTAYVPSNYVVSSDNDLSALIYLSIDENYLYAAFDIEDDVISTNVSSDSYKNDCPDIFIGLYDGHGTPHSALKRGAEPDYHIRFNKEKAIFDGGGISKTDSLLIPGENYYWDVSFPSGYIVEAKIPLDLLAERGGDTRFVSKIGKRIPIDFSVNDADGAEREGMLCYSSKNEDNSYLTPARWTYTWIGDQWFTGVAEDKNITLDSYQLLQNYPNPFNPSTQISYVLMKQGMVTVKVYDILGREVKTLVSQDQSSGLHTINFDASTLASGIYIYKIDSGNFHSSKKMLFLK